MSLLNNIFNGFKQYITPFVKSNMYVAVDGQSALVVDPHVDEDCVSGLKNRGVERVLVLLTHEHADHTSGVNCFLDKFDVKVVAQIRCAETVAIAKNNRPLIYLALACNNDESDTEELLGYYKRAPIKSINVDETFEKEYSAVWQGHQIKMISCPGHSPGSCIIMFDDDMVFSGDYLIPDTPVILRFPGGSKVDYDRYAAPLLASLPLGIKIMPGHGMPYRR